MVDGLVGFYLNHAYERCMTHNKACFAHRHAGQLLLLICCQSAALIKCSSGNKIKQLPLFHCCCLLYRSGLSMLSSAHSPTVTYLLLVLWAWLALCRLETECIDIAVLLLYYERCVCCRLSVALASMRVTHLSASNHNKLFSIASAQAGTSLFCLDAGPVTCVSHSLDVSSL